MRVIWSDPALSELASIREYISINSPQTAEKFTVELYRQVNMLLKQFPRYGRKIPEIDKDEFREIIRGNYRIMYRITKDDLRILAVRNSRQLFTGSSNTRGRLLLCAGVSPSSSLRSASPPVRASARRGGELKM